MMKYTLFIICLIACSFTVIKKPKRILVFSATKGYRHKSIDAGKIMFLTLGAKNNILVDTTEDASVFTKKNLRNYKAVVFLNTTGNVLDSLQQLAFTRYIKHGGGFVGIHSATDTEYDWPWYNRLVGAYFASHPKPQYAHFDVINKKSPATADLPDTLYRLEELYNFKSVQRDLITVLMTVDEKSYSGGTMAGDHPMCWQHKVGRGRSFYTELGHHPETYTDPVFQQIVWGGLQWAMK